MLLIDCPWCGPRDEIEFVCGGESHIVRPAPEVDDATWANYLFMRTNPKGRHAERWGHVHGCGQWFSLVRDTVTHEISGVYRFDQPRPVEGD